MTQTPRSPRPLDLAGMILAFGLVLATTIFVRGDGADAVGDGRRPSAARTSAIAERPIPTEGVRQLNAALR